MSRSPSVVILGAGPAGTTAAIHLAREGIRHLLVDKERFPRDKVCGDALSGKVVAELKLIDPDLHRLMQSDDLNFLGSYGVRFVAPNGKSLDIPFKTDIEKLEMAPGFLSRRMDFDQWMTERLDHRFSEVRYGWSVTDITREGPRIRLELRKDDEVETVFTDLVIGAEGERSLTAKSLAGFRKEHGHYCAGIRTYYEGVTGFHEKNFIELHFIRESLPGYLWIFPLPGGKANVGIGMLTAVISKKKIDLKRLLQEILREHPAIRERFKNARLVDGMRGWGLPLGTKRRPVSGDGFLLAGDAASLIDPFTGEGIGNAMTSGRIAATCAATAVRTGRFDAGHLKHYDDRIYASLWKELRLSRTLQRLSGHAWLFNFVVNKAATSRGLREAITGMFDDVEARSRLSRPGFYLKLLLRGD